MTDKQIDMLTDEIENSKEAVPKLGELLKQAREAKGLSIDNVAKQLHLRPTIVRDIESDDFSNIASATYVKGYVKNYARIVEADKQAIEAALAQYFPVINAPSMQSFSRKTTREAKEGRLMMVTYFIFFILLVLLVVWWVQKSEMMTGVDMSKLTAEEVAQIGLDDRQNTPVYVEAPQTQVDGTSEAQTGVEPIAASGENPVDGPVDSEVNSTVANSSTAEADTATLTVTSAEQSKLRMELVDDCWIKITDSQGKTLVNGLKVGGSALNVFGQEPFEVILGAPQSLKLSINGEDVDLEKYPEGRVARLTVTSSANL
ncbi:RodZ domain-containing protein [Shewanella sp. Isolate11]|uniref:RodZ domain-containing protein n=1 Tax=Shewanella sp. Isolate11 TaxID=2908530 RepID=UPI001EFE1C8F|nr:RodZ domain-containing protein [Shewanella sp. Isolate11]MCG9697212.1 DUF4115 domain-containing protein [Shewanella sp. Isolate11]